MPLATLLLIAFGVSADAFAVAVGKGLGMRRLQLRTAATLAVAFGLAQGLMPVLGWLLGTQLADAIVELDHWIAFGLLAFVGARMVREALRSDRGDDPAPGAGGLQVRELLLLSVATSIDALAVGISFAFLDVSILAAASLIGGVTLVLSFAGVVIGQRAGARFRRPAEVAGGLVLIGIGLKILLDHLGVL